MTDLVLVNPNHKTPAPFAAVEPPIWLGMIAGYHSYQGKDVTIIDAEALDLTLEQTVAAVEKLRPKQTIIVVMGANPSVSSTPKWPITEELLKHLDADVTGIHPIAVHHPRAIHKPFVGLPAIPWQLFPKGVYRAHNWHCLSDLSSRKSYGILYTSLNCPFNCSFCNIHTLYGGSRLMRPRFFEAIKKDLDYFANSGIKNIKIWDELFCLNEMKVREICDYIINSFYQFNIWAYARVDTVTPSMLHMMKKAGINWLAYGFESADTMVLEENTKGVTSRNVARAIAMTKAAGIHIMANFMFGLPGETEGTMQASLEMAKRENFEYVNFYVALPYPGSDWYRGLVDKPTDWSSFSQFSPNICAPPSVVAFRDRAFKMYFDRPEYYKMIEHKFGSKGVKHIKDMLTWQIRS